MKLLHTADWHLGKRLDHVSRLDEQHVVMQEICEIAEKEEVDAVLIAGDLFDHINPSIEAIELLYKSCKRLSRDGSCAVVGIAGNHDSPDRIEAPNPLARECGIILNGYQDSIIRPFALDSGLKILRQDKGFIELGLPRTDTPLRLLLTPYANEIRLRTYLGEENKEAQLREILESRWRELADIYCDNKGVNILMTHLFMVEKEGKRPEEPEDEKTILTIGGAQEIFTENIPNDIQYVALGHLHRKQIISDTPCPVVYSGSPLAYSMSEAGQTKYVQLLEAEANKAIQHTAIPLEQGKVLARKRFSDVQEAVVWLQSQTESWIELSLETQTYLTAEERKQLFDAHPGLLTIIPIIENQEDASAATPAIDLSKNMESLFKDYFRHKQGQDPNERLLALFKEMLNRR